MTPEEERAKLELGDRWDEYLECPECGVKVLTGHIPEKKEILVMGRMIEGTLDRFPCPRCRFEIPFSERKHYAAPVVADSH